VGLSQVVNAIATRDDDRFAVLLYGYDAAAEPTTAERNVEIALPAGVPAQSLRVFQVNDAENNILAAWRAMGNPAYLRREQLAELQAANALRPSVAYSLTQNPGGATALKLHMRTPGVALAEGRT
jgi:beta-xylosidase